MDREFAHALVANLVSRLVSNGQNFRLPEGVLTRLEVDALLLLSGGAPIPEQTPASTHEHRDPVALQLACVSASPPSENEIRLCLDFGTAMSKAWATGATIEETIPLVIGRPADKSDTLVVPSTIFISKSGRIFIGASAERQHEAEIHLGRNRFDNIKRLLSEVHPGVDLDDLPLEPDIDPTCSGLTKGDLLVLYLAWLTDIALKAFPSVVTDKFSAPRAILRRFAMPCFEEAVDDVPSATRAAWAEKTMCAYLKRAQVVADSLSAEWDGLTTHRAKRVLDAARAMDARLSGMPLLAATPSVREPVAAGAMRFSDYVEGEGSPARRLVLVVDAGAGTTDFALFQSFRDAAGELSFALVSKGVRMSRLAGNRVDLILGPLILKACGVHPDNGNPWGDEEFRIIKADLASQIRGLKRDLFAHGSISISLRPGASGVLRREDVEADPGYQELGQNLITQRNETLDRAFSEDEIRKYKEHSDRLGKPVPIHVLLTGGSANLPIFQALGQGVAILRGTKFQFFTVTKLPRWVSRLPPDLAELVASQFAQCAVAIGGSVPELPREQADLSAPIAPPRTGPRYLERYQVTGT